MRLSPLFSAMVLALPLVALTACYTQSGSVIEPEPRWFMMADEDLPAARWDHLPEGKLWTREILSNLIDRGQGVALIEVVPKDIEQWCPSYTETVDFDGDIKRAAFWIGLMSAMAKHESTYNPQAVGGGGRWFGLLQISPDTAKAYGCAATTGEALKNGSENLRCAVRIMAKTVPRDGVVAAGGRGVAADWGPFHSAAKRDDMMRWVSSQDYCR